jgi:tetratricopeptide (TPR) repeat protein
VQDLASCTLRICDTSGNTRGTGFVVSDGLIVTCSHVVQDEASQKRGDPRPDKVTVVFHANGARREAQVLSDFWRPAEGDDMAVLRLLPRGELLPAGVTPAVLGITRACRGHKMLALGFPEMVGGRSVLAEGELRGIVSVPDRQPMLQMDARPIQRGMSGALVLDLTTQRVVGMVSEYLAEAPLEWATTSETLHAVCPDLQLHPPQAVEDYLAALREYCANLPYLTLHDIRPPKTLDEVYVPLKARPQPRKDDKQGREKEERQERDEERVMREFGRSEPLSIAEVMQKREQSHVLILGEPGAGKSTLLRQLAERAWDAPEKIGLDTRYLPILVPLRRLASAEGSLEDRLNRALTAELMLTQELPKGFFTDWPAQTDAKWLVLLDALDEVPADERARLMQWLKGMLNTVGQSCIVITSRPSGYSQGELDDKLFGHYDLLSFTPEQTGEFAHKWFSDKAEDFLKELERVRAGALRGTPLLLTIAAKVYLEKGTLPERRSGLYGQFVDIWLAEAEQRGLKAELGERMCKVTKFALARLALAMTEQPSQVSQAMLEHVAATYLHDALLLSDDEAGTDAAKLIEVLSRRSGVFTHQGGMYDFIHSTFREYFTAQQLFENWQTNPNRLVAQLRTWLLKAGWWHETIVLLGELLEVHAVGHGAFIEQLAELARAGVEYEEVVYIISSIDPTYGVRLIPERREESFSEHVNDLFKFLAPAWCIQCGITIAMLFLPSGMRLANSIDVGFAVSLPVLVYCIYKFAKPGLKQSERQYGLYFIFSALLYSSGVLLRASARLTLNNVLFGPEMDVWIPMLAVISAGVVIWSSLRPVARLFKQFSLVWYIASLVLIAFFILVVPSTFWGSFQMFVLTLALALRSSLTRTIEPWSWWEPSVIRIMQEEGLYSLGQSYIESGNVEKTIEVCQDALSLAKSHHNSMVEAKTLRLLGRAHNKLGNFERAAEVLQEGLKQETVVTKTSSY